MDGLCLCVSWSTKNGKIRYKWINEWMNDADPIGWLLLIWLSLMGMQNCTNWMMNECKCNCFCVSCCCIILHGTFSFSTYFSFLNDQQRWEITQQLQKRFGWQSRGMNGEGSNWNSLGQSEGKIHSFIMMIMADWLAWLAGWMIMKWKEISCGKFIHS